MASEVINLDWNKFQSVTVKTFNNLHGDCNFSDVTLASEDCKPVKAHKVILSSCSQFFKNILVENNHQNPFIYLKGIDHVSLTNIVKFIYSGQVEINPDDLTTFLMLANDLKIEGLLTDKAEDSDMATLVSTSIKEQGLKIKDVATLVNNTVDDEPENNLETEESRQDNLEETDKLFSNECFECGKLFKDRSKLKRHKLSVHEGITFDCEFCPTNFSTQAYLGQHIANMHENIYKSSKENPKSKAVVSVIDSMTEQDKDMKLVEEMAYGNEDNGKKCDRCELVVSTGKILMKHRREKHPGEKFYCDLCDKEFANSTSFSVHRVIHSGIKFSCTSCSVQSSSKSNLHRHVKNVHM